MTTTNTSTTNPAPNPLPGPTAGQDLHLELLRQQIKLLEENNKRLETLTKATSRTGARSRPGATTPRKPPLTPEEKAAKAEAAAKAKEAKAEAKRAKAEAKKAEAEADRAEAAAKKAAKLKAQKAATAEKRAKLKHDRMVLRELRNIRDANDGAWTRTLFLLVFAFTSMGAWGLKQFTLEVVRGIPFVDWAEPTIGANGGGTFSTAGPALAVGDEVAGFRVTSVVGPRQSPGGVGSTNHKGIDLATPVGTPILNPQGSEGRWECTNSAGGGIGLKGRVQGHDIVMWHLAKCIGGDGKVIGQTGNTGGATTGPHLHLEVHKDGQILKPTKAMVTPFLQEQAQGAVAIGDIDLEFIKGLEGLHPCAYPDGAQISWGYGTKAPSASACIEEPQALAEMTQYLEQNCLPLLPVNLAGHPGKATAAASLCYNAGTGVKDWDIWGQIQSGNWQDVRFTSYTRSTTGVSLLTRRQKEQAKWDAN